MIESARLEHGAGEMFETVAPPLPMAAVTGAPSRLDPAARFRSLVDAHFDFIWRSLRGLGVPAHAADDAAQHVFLIASQKLDAIAVGNERSFLFGTAVGVAANARRARARVRELACEESLAAHADTTPDPEQLTAMKQARRMLDEILDAMDDDLRVTFLLFELEGLTMIEIAELLGIPHGTAASRLRRAREAFQAIKRRVQARAKSRGGAR